MKVHALIHALQTCLTGKFDRASREVLRSFRQYGVIRQQADTRCLQRFVQEHLESIVHLLYHNTHPVRHLAAFALGYTANARAVRPLLTLLLNQRDFFDHDFAYEAFARLGEVAVEELFHIAESGSPEEAFYAVQALGHCGRVALPYLSRLARRGKMPESFFVAYENIRDAQGLPDLMIGLRSPQPEVRKDAVAAADSLLEVAYAKPQFLNLINRAEWGSIFAGLYAEEGLRRYAISCLGWLRDERHLDIVLQATTSKDEDLAVEAVEALGRYRSLASRQHLSALMEQKNLEIACEAAVQLAQDPDTPRALKVSAGQVMLRGILHLKGTWAWCDAAWVLPKSRAGMTALINAAGGLPKQNRSRAAEALVFYVNSLHRPAPTLRRILQRCNQEAAVIIRKKWRMWGKVGRRQKV